MHVQLQKYAFCRMSAGVLMSGGTHSTIAHNALETAGLASRQVSSRTDTTACICLLGSAISA